MLGFTAYPCTICTYRTLEGDVGGGGVESANNNKIVEIIV